MGRPIKLWEKETKNHTYAIYFRGSILFFRLDIRWKGYRHFDLTLFGLDFYWKVNSFYGCSYLRPIKILEACNRFIYIDMYVHRMFQGGPFLYLNIDLKNRIGIQLIVLGFEIEIKTFSFREFKEWKETRAWIKEQEKKIKTSPTTS